MELFINAALIAASVVLFCYWFRYVCLLILSAESAHDYGEEVALANQLSFPEIRSTLRRHEVTDLDSLHRSLERDFTIITYLLDHTPVNGCESSFEDAMLKILFRTMGGVFRLTRRNLRSFSSDALEEMIVVVAYFANEFGARVAQAAH